MDKLYSIGEVARGQFTGYKSVTTIRKLIDEGELEAKCMKTYNDTGKLYGKNKLKKKRKVWKIPESSIRAFQQRHGIESTI